MASLERAARGGYERQIAVRGASGTHEAHSLLALTLVNRCADLNSTYATVLVSSIAGRWQFLAM